MSIKSWVGAGFCTTIGVIAAMEVWKKIKKSYGVVEINPKRGQEADTNDDTQKED